MNRIRSIIIDDETANREILSGLLGELCPSIEVIGMAESAAAGYQLIMELQPELVFLDVRMPVQNGFDLLRMFEDIPFQVVFVTAYDEYAIQAFEFNAVDYILKPIDYEKLVQSVGRVERRIQLNQGNSDMIHFIRSLDEKTQLLNRISLHKTGKVRIVDLDQICFIRARRNYSEVITTDNQRLVSSKSLSNYEQLLGPYPNFIRVNKSHLINVRYIESYSKGTTCYIAMKNTEEELEVSRRKKRQILHFLKCHTAPQLA